MAEHISFFSIKTFPPKLLLTKYNPLLEMMF